MCRAACPSLIPPRRPEPDPQTIEPQPTAGSTRPDVIPVTNAIEALNRQLRKAIKTKGHFPNEQAAKKLIYLAIVNAVPAWTRTRNWTTALLAFKIHFGDRLPD